MAGFILIGIGLQMLPISHQIAL